MTEEAQLVDNVRSMLTRFVEKVVFSQFVLPITYVHDGNNVMVIDWWIHIIMIP